MTSGSLVSTSNVCSCPTDFAGSPSWTGSASRPRARSTSDAPCLPNRRTTRSGGRAARSPIVRTPYSAQGRGRLLADAPQPADRPAARGTPPRPRRHDDEPVRLPEVRGDLGHELGRRDADRRGQPDLRPRLVLDPPGDRRAVAEQCRCDPVTSRNASSIEIGSTSGVNRRRIAMTSRLASLVARDRRPAGRPRPDSAGTPRASDIAEWMPKTRAS